MLTLNITDRQLKEVYDRVSVGSVSEAARPIHSLEEQLSKLLIMIVLLCCVCTSTRIVESQGVLHIMTLYIFT